MAWSSSGRRGRGRLGPAAAALVLVSASTPGRVESAGRGDSGQRTSASAASVASSSAAVVDDEADGDDDADDDAGASESSAGGGWRTDRLSTTIRLFAGGQ